MAKKTRKKTLKQLFLALIILSVGYLFSNLSSGSKKIKKSLCIERN